jgi:hypothetical protein
MNQQKFLLRLASIMLMFVLTACSMGTLAPTTTPMPTNTLVPPTATFTPMPTFTATPIPMLSVNEAMDCYAGPSEQYDKVASLETGTEIQIVGQSDDGAFWIVSTESGSECWLAKENTTVTVGEVSVLPLVIPPATPTLSPPAAPSDLTVTYACPSRIERDSMGRKIIFVHPTFNLFWKDNSNNEDGFVISKEEEELTRVSPDVTVFTFTTTAIKSYEEPATLYSVAAFNAAGESEKVYIYVLLKCPR